MKKEIYLTILFDYYESLLTNSQKDYFKNYYFNNLSLAEISENMKVSRNAIHKQLKVIEEKLIFFETNLHLYEKAKKIEKILEKITNEEIKKEIEELL